MEDPTNPIEIDDLKYGYNGNQLINVADTNVHPDGFNDGHTGTVANPDYLYDSYGNLIEDKNKDITAITYNHLNLPTKVAFGTQGFIDYIYTADGIKLEKKVTETATNTTTITTNYIDGFQHTDGELDFFPQAEGMVEVTTDNLGSTSFNYVFHYTDHLGNIRLRYALDPQTSELAILEEKHYYPFGLTHEGYSTGNKKKFEKVNNNIVLTPVNPFIGDSYKYGFGGKEYDDSMDINTYDFGARNYDPALGRWMNIDPLAEDYYDQSAYNYALNNPAFFIDPDGRRVDVSDLANSDENEDSWLLLNLAIDLAEYSGQTISFDKEGDKTFLFGSGSCGANCNEVSSYISHILDPDGETINLTSSQDGSGGHSFNGEHKVELDARQIYGFQVGADKKGADPNTFSVGLSFLHETLHTEYGTSFYNNTEYAKYKGFDGSFNDSGQVFPGPGSVVTDIVNRFRKNIGQTTIRSYYNASYPSSTLNLEVNGKSVNYIPQKVDPPSLNRTQQKRLNALKNE